jgi:hypothetical protein
MASALGSYRNQPAKPLLQVLISEFRLIPSHLVPHPSSSITGASKRAGSWKKWHLAQSNTGPDSYRSAIQINISLKYKNPRDDPLHENQNRITMVIVEMEPWWMQRGDSRAKKNTGYCIHSKAVYITGLASSPMQRKPMPSLRRYWWSECQCTRSTNHPPPWPGPPEGSRHAHQHLDVHNLSELHMPSLLLSTTLRDT